MKKAKIVITTIQQEVENFVGKQRIYCINSSYIDIVTKYDALPILLAPIEVGLEKEIEILMRGIDGLILSGGEDLSPELYSEELMVNYQDDLLATDMSFSRSNKIKPNKKRDLFEIKLYRYAKKNRIPVLGICRGMQLINVAEKGSLYQKIPQSSIRHELEKDGLIHYHEINIDPKSRLFTWLRRDNYFVSSMHHQAIKGLGKDLMVSARASDGIIEIIECVLSEQYIVGVQAHIEQTTTNLLLFNILFESFFAQANRVADRDEL